MSFGNKHFADPYLSSIICVEAVSADHNIEFMPKEIALSENSDYTDDMRESLNDSVFKDDCIWRIGPDYAGCRDIDFRFNAEAFKANATRPNVKMIELELPAFNNKNPKAARSLSYSKPTNSGTHAALNAAHTPFCNSESMVIFLDSLRQLSGKKPVGINLRITDKKEFHEICYAFCKTHIIPDFIVIEGCENESFFLNSVSIKPAMPLFEALQFASKTVEMYGLSKEIKLIAASEIYSTFDVLRLRALGADAISMRNHFLRGDKPYQKHGIKSTVFARRFTERLRSDILNSTMNMLKAWGYVHINDITVSSFFRILDSLQGKNGDKNQDEAGRGIAGSRNYQLSRKSFSETNTGSELFLN